MSNDYKGGCQCGAVTYEANVDISSPITCNCSRCERLGFVLAFTPEASFNLHSGESSLTEYKFNKGDIQHLFCKQCGVESFAYGKAPDGSGVVAININCLDGVDPRALECQHYDGASL